MKEYINKIALLASVYIENMKEEVEARQDTIIRSNLLKETGMEEHLMEQIAAETVSWQMGIQLWKKLILLQKVLRKKKTLMLMKCGDWYW